MSTERERIAMVERIFGRSAPGVPLGIGDDAAVIDLLPRVDVPHPTQWSPG